MKQNTLITSHIIYNFEQGHAANSELRGGQAQIGIFLVL